MRPIRRVLENIQIDYPLEEYLPIEDVLFLKIETTGYTARTATLYLIGVAFYENGSWNSMQWFAMNPSEEKDIIEGFFNFARDYKYLFHFNGNNFDLPFITDKCSQYNLPYDFSEFTGVDIYKRVVPLQKFLHLSNCKQRTIERFLGISYEDPFEGGQTIGIYHDFLNNPTEYFHDAILCHNKDDLAEMLALLPILSYYDLFSEAIEVTKVQARSYTNINGDNCKELFMKVELPSPLPREVSGYYKGCYFTASHDVGAIKVPITEGELKYYYTNYQDYYYLPEEDTAVHKSLASYADKKDREQAKASNCYTKKESLYLPQWTNLIMPVFKKEYAEKEYYFEITPELKKDRRIFKLYALHIMSLMRDGE